jgi:hypothetical protein
MADPSEPPATIDPSPRRRNQLTVARAMGLVALVAVSLLPNVPLVYLTFALALAISGILAVRWAVPWPEVLVPRRYRKPAWVLWWLLLLTAPLGIGLLDARYGGNTQGTDYENRPWAAVVVDVLTFTHVLGLTPLALVAAAALTRGERCLAAWIFVVALGFWTANQGFLSLMSITGNWL